MRLSLALLLSVSWLAMGQAVEAAPGQTTLAQVPQRIAPEGEPADDETIEQFERAVEEGYDELRRRPGAVPEEDERDEINVDVEAISPAPRDVLIESVPIPDRWRLIENLGVNARWWDPYNQNTLKGDRPIFGQDWFVNVLAISDTIAEPRSFPVPVAQAGSLNPGSGGPFSDPDSFVFSENLILSVSLIKGETAYKPQDLEFRVTPVINYNFATANERGLLLVDPEHGTERHDFHVGLQEAFIDYHIRNVSDRYDFDSVRVGIQPFSTDFRGFLFQDNQLGVRLFGTRDNNLWQYNLAWFRRLEKDTNSGLNDVQQLPRDDDVFVFNLYRQDFPFFGFTTQGIVLYNRNSDDGQHYDQNGFLVRPAPFGGSRPRSYDVTYLGVNVDGHIGRFNLTGSYYLALGENRNSPISNVESDIRAFFLAAEPSIDFDWVRVRGSFLYASGDRDPFDDVDGGFDAVFENPQFAGADTSYWIRQAIPSIGGGFVTLSGRNGVLPSLRSSKEEGQSNFTNPGLILAGAGADFDILPELRFSTNANYLRLNETAVLEVTRGQADIPNDIGWDVSGAFIYRPLQTQNIVLRLSGAVLVPGDGYRALFGTSDGSDVLYSVLANLTLTY